MPTQQEIDAAAKRTQDAIAKTNPTAVSNVDVTGAASATGKALTGTAGGPEGAYNPYTKGMETVNPTVGVNTGAYSAQEKAKLATSYGYDPMKVGLDQFQRNADGSLGLKLPDISKQPAQWAAITPVPSATVTPVPTATEETAPVASPAEQLAAEKAKLAKEQEAKNLYYVNEQYRQAQEQLNASSKKQLEDMQRQYDEAISNQQNRMANDAANAGTIIGTQGAGRSARIQQAVSAMNQKNKDLYTSLVISKDRDTMYIADQLKRAQESMDTKYKEQVTAAQDEMLKQIRAMDATGELNSKQGFAVARSFLENVLDTTLAAQEDYVNGLQAGYDQYKAYAEQSAAQKEVDTALTKQMNDGYVYNKFGEKTVTTDDLGNQTYLRYSPEANEKFLTSTTLPDGSMGALMQKADGTTYFKRFETGVQTAFTPEQVSAYASAYASGKLSDAQMKSLPQSVQAQIVQGAVGMGFAGSKEAVKVTVNGKEKTMLYDKTTGTFTDPFATTQAGSIASGVSVAEDWTVSFDDKAEAAARKAGINVDLLEIPDGTVRKRAECGQYVNDTLGTPSLFKDSLESKIKACNSTKPAVGSAVVLDVGTDTGHVGIVVGVDEASGNILVKSSNAHGYDENGNPTGISTDWISYVDDQGNANPAVKGFYAPKFEAGATEGGGVSQEREYADLNLTSRILNATSGSSFGEKEMASAARKVELGRSMGKSDAEILNDVAGFNVPKEKAELGNTAIEWLNKVGVTTANSKYAKAIAANITDGNMKWAANNIEKEAFTSEAGKLNGIGVTDREYRTLYQNYKQTMDALEANKDKIGVVSGRWADAKKSLSGDASLQNAQSKLTALFAVLRKSFAGSAVTPSELEALQDYIDGKTSEPLENIKAKLTSIMQQKDNEYGQKRDQVGLPPLEDESQIIGDRSSLYFGWQAAQSSPKYVPWQEIDLDNLWY